MADNGEGEEKQLFCLVSGTNFDTKTIFNRILQGV